MTSPDEKIVRLLGEAGGEPVSTTDIAESLDISQPGAWRRLERLGSAGIVTRETDGASMTDWWRLREEALAERDG